jgi:hypothetical protein
VTLLVLARRKRDDGVRFTSAAGSCDLISSEDIFNLQRRTYSCYCLVFGMFDEESDKENFMKLFAEPVDCSLSQSQQIVLPGPELSCLKRQRNSQKCATKRK